MAGAGALARGGERPRQDVAPAGAVRRAAHRLARGASPLFASSGGRSPRCRSSPRPSLIGCGRRAGDGLRRHRALRCLAPRFFCRWRSPAVLRIGGASGAAPARALVLRRRAPGDFGPVAGDDGAAARARDQYRRRRHGGRLSADLRRLARRTPRRRNLLRSGDARRRARHRGVGAHAARHHRDPSDLARPDAARRLAGRPRSAWRRTRPIRSIFRCSKAAPTLVRALHARTPSSISEQLARRLKTRLGATLDIPGIRRKLAARGSSESIPITAMPRDNCASITRGWRAISPMRRACNYSLRVAPGAVTRVMEEMRTRFGRRSRASSIKAS